MGGTDEPHNLTEPISILDHAIAHLVLFRRFGHWEDEFVWKMLSGQIDQEDRLAEMARMRETGRVQSEETVRRRSDSVKKAWAEGRFKRDKEKNAELCKQIAPKRKCYGDGREWESKSAAARALGVTHGAIGYRCKTGYKDWRFL
jgi:hypothetical protein